MAPAVLPACTACLQEVLPVGTFRWSFLRKRFGPVGTMRRSGADSEEPCDV